jgi:hypothetical protein
VVSVTDPYGRILVSLDRRRYLFFQVAPQLYSRGSVNPVLDPLPQNLVAPGIEPGPLDLYPGTLDIRPQMRLYIYKVEDDNSMFCLALCHVCVMFSPRSR